MSTKFQIGDVVWRPHFDASENYVECPDCGGTGRIRVIFHDETIVSIDCGECAVGYNPPTGRVKVYDRVARAELTIVTGLEIKPDGVTYHLGGNGSWYRTAPEDEVCATEEEALAKAAEIAAKFDADERAKIQTKDHPTHTWAWNASYHRKMVKQAQRDLEYHTKKLNAANLKAKTDRAAISKATAPSSPADAG